MAHTRDTRDRGSPHHQMGRLPSANANKYQALLGHCHRLPCCIPNGQVWGSGIATVPAEAGPKEGDSADQIIKGARERSNAYEASVRLILAHGLVAVVATVSTSCEFSVRSREPL